MQGLFLSSFVIHLYHCMNLLRLCCITVILSTLIATTHIGTLCSEKCHVNRFDCCASGQNLNKVWLSDSCSFMQQFKCSVCCKYWKLQEAICIQILVSIFLFICNLFLFNKCPILIRIHYEIEHCNLQGHSSLTLWPLIYWVNEKVSQPWCWMLVGYVSRYKAVLTQK